MQTGSLNDTSWSGSLRMARFIMKSPGLLLILPSESPSNPPFSTNTGDMDQAFERYAEVGSAVGISGPSQGSGAAAGGKPAAGGQAAGGKGGPVKAGAIKKKLMLRRREPLTSVIKLLPEYFPDELYSSSDRRYVRCVLACACMQLPACAGEASAAGGCCEGGQLRGCPTKGLC